MTLTIPTKWWVFSSLWNVTSNFIILLCYFQLSLRRYAKDAFAVSSIPQNSKACKLYTNADCWNWNTPQHFTAVMHCFRSRKQLYEVTGIAQLLSYSVLTGNVGLGIMKELEELEDIQNKRPFLRQLTGVFHSPCVQLCNKLISLLKLSWWICCKGVRITTVALCITHCVWWAHICNIFNRTVFYRYFTTT